MAKGNIILLQRLLLYGNGGVDERNPNTGTTALRAVLMLKRREAVTVLLGNGASVDIPGRIGWSAVHWAVLSGNREMTEDVLKHGVNRDGGQKMVVSQGRHRCIWLLD